mmetsp:Transcript_2890/g.4333  ORF Transcript_2890/g.4333 Transcript_2890/m.4333 type:complete len:191 (+) Transcript_2890:2047-2619(+)
MNVSSDPPTIQMVPPMNHTQKSSTKPPVLSGILSLLTEQCSAIAAKASAPATIRHHTVPTARIPKQTSPVAATTKATTTVTVSSDQSDGAVSDLSNADPNKPVTIDGHQNPKSEERRNLTRVTKRDNSNLDIISSKYLPSELRNVFGAPLEGPDDNFNPPPRLAPERPYPSPPYKDITSRTTVCQVCHGR